MKWHRRPYGYLSADGRYFLERGGNWEGPRGGVDSTRHMWLIWRVAIAGVDYELDEFGPYNTGGYGVSTVRRLDEVTGDAADGDEIVMAHVADEGWLADAKQVAADLAAEVA